MRLTLLASCGHWLGEEGFEDEDGDDGAIAEDRHAPESLQAAQRRAERFSLLPDPKRVSAK